MSTELFSTLPYKVADITLADFGRMQVKRVDPQGSLAVIVHMQGDIRIELAQLAE